MFLLIFGGIGVLALAILALRFLAAIWRIIYPYVLARPKNLEALAGRGNWAMVTGCTDGIGRAYAEELAQRGFSLVLVSRSPQKLGQMEEEFRRRFAKPDYVTIPFDFSETSVEEYRHKLLHRVKGLEIGILVNNVGAMHAYPQRFHDAEGGLEKMAQILTINMFPVTLLSAYVLEQMVQRGKGVIVNISSVMAYSPYFYGAIYSATKAYVNWFTAALRKEYAPQNGITIQTICPGVVITKMSSMLSEGKKPSLFMPSAENFAKSAIGSIGNASETCGSFGHQLQHEISGLFPTFMQNWVVKMIMLKTQKNWLKKRAEGNNKEGEGKLFVNRGAI